MRSISERITSSVSSMDLYTFVVMSVFCLMSVIYYPFIPNAANVLVLDVFIASAIGAIVVLYALTEVRLFAMLRRFYIIPVIYMMYAQVHVFVQTVHPIDYDDWLIAADRAMFGVDPTVWLSKFSVPVLTEYLQICYFLFYLMPIMQAIELWRKGDLERLDIFARGMAFCYFISYLAYFALPAIGPRFTLHDFGSLNSDLPGVILTPLLRDLINVGGGIAVGTADPALVVNRDCMPSGHTMLTLVNIFFGFRNRSQFRWVFLLIGGSLIISTVYLRYHYAVDVFVGAILALLTLPLEPVVNSWWESFKPRAGSVWKTLLGEK